LFLLLGNPAIGDFRIGTREGLDLKYAVSCRSKKQRAQWYAAKAIRLGTRKRRRWLARRERARARQRAQQTSS
jgi:hypothetical protein